jgi:chlorobactene glucosyltransferase
MLYQVIIAVGLVIFLVNLVLNLRSLRKPGDGRNIPVPAPLVSILVPARDEEANIRACLESLQKQDYPDFEILALDDNSVDDTAGIVNEMAARDSRIRLIQGDPLPDDWAGKPFACHQLARRAKGSWLLFVDADTVHAPEMLKGVLSLAVEMKTSLLSGFPRQLADSLPLKIIIPVQYFIILGWLPLWWLHKRGRPSLAIGQFMLFSASEYRRIGGHEAVKSRIVEDVCLGIEVGRKGGRHVAIDLSSVVSTNLYEDVGAAWRGFGKSIYAIVAMMPIGLLGLVTAAYFFYIAPFWWLWNGFFEGRSDLLERGIVVLQVAVMLLMRWLVDNRFREPGVSIFFHPLGLGFYLLNVLHSGLRWMVGAGVTWKERFYGGEESVVK